MDIYVRKKMDIRKINLNRNQKKNIIQLLQNGSLKLAGQALRGSNSTFLCDISVEHQSIKAIYKPSKGEQPLWDFPHFTLAQREVATFIVSEILGWNFVPPTVLRTKPAVFGRGSLQFYIEHDPYFHYLNAPEINNGVFMKVAIFDLLINNADRKSSHVLFDADKAPSWVPTCEDLLKDFLMQHQDAQHMNELCLTCHPVLVEMSASCDHVQENIRVARFIAGLAIPESEQTKMKRKDALYIWKLGPLMDEGQSTRIYYLYFSARHLVTRALEEATCMKPCMRLRSQALVHLQAWFAQHASRPGLILLKV